MKLISKSIFVKIAWAVMCSVCVYCHEVPWRADSEAELDNEALPDDHYSFVALIDIVFTNGSKKICTGTIIHDNVVITAAHCFQMNDNHHIQPEMTASFVVIGTKKMFNTGYEQYLPIERIVIHPNYTGWTADLALVHTFSGMMSDKPGQVVPLATQHTSTPVDADVMVFSWGKEDDVTVPFILATETTTVYKKEITSESNKFEELSDYNIKKNETLRQRRKKRLRFRLKKNRKKHRTEYVPVTRARKHRKTLTTSNQFDKPMSSIEENNRYKYRQQRYENLTDFNSEVEQKSWENKLGKLNQLYERSEVNSDRMRQRDRRFTRGTMSYYRNGWRRKMCDQQNKLTIEIFGFVNMHACQKLTNKAVPMAYRMKKRQEFLCYASDRRYITEDDAGAPAMRRGRLVAVTLGGVDFDGEHLAVGMKMKCFCSWIAENIPKSGTEFQCCKNCCEPVTEETDTKKHSYRHSRKKKKL